MVFLLFEVTFLEDENSGSTPIGIRIIPPHIQCHFFTSLFSKSRKNLSNLVRTKKKLIPVSQTDH